MIPNCAATRHVHFELDGSGPAVLPTPTLEDWPKVTWEANTKTSTRVNLDTLTKEEVASWKPGQTLLLNGRLLTGRDAAHKRIQDMPAKGEKLDRKSVGRGKRVEVRGEHGGRRIVKKKQGTKKRI